MESSRFSLDDFVDDPSHDKLVDIRKVDWCLIARHYDIATTTSMRKEQLKNVVVEALVEQGVLQEEAVSALTPAGLPPRDKTPPQGYSMATNLDAAQLFELEKLRLQSETQIKLVEAESRRLEAESRRQETEAQIRLAEVEKEKEVQLAQIEAEEKKSTNELKLKITTEEEAQRRREVEKKRIKPSEAASQLPSFVEDDVDSYFRTFEKIAAQNEWPRERWLAFLVPKLVGKAYKVYATLDADSDYEEVKNVILRAYSVTPDSYRQRFRNLRKGFEQTYTEFAQELRRTFKKWLEATDTKSFEQLVDLLVLEQFKARLPFFILRYIEEQREKGVMEAAGLADAHHLLVKSISGGDGKIVKASSDALVKPNKPRTNQSQGIEANYCSYCKKPGHSIKDCRHPNCKVSKQLADHSRLPNKPVLAFSVSDDQDDGYEPYKREGTISHPEIEGQTTLTLLRDTGASMSMLQREAVSNIHKAFTGDRAIASTLGTKVPCPLARIHIDSPIFTGYRVVMVTDQPFDVPGVQLLLGNDVKRPDVILLPLVVDEPIESVEPAQSDAFPICAVTRAQARAETPPDPPSPSGIPDSKFSHLMSKEKLVEEQESDPSLIKVRHQVSEDTMDKTPYFYYHDGVLMRKYRPPHLLPSDTWADTHQVVLPESPREAVIKLAHDGTAGHLGVKKTYAKILEHFFWPGMRRQISSYVKSCHLCQVVGKPNQTIPPAPLLPISVPSEPFSKIVIDCVGPLPKTKKGNEYLLTIMDPTTRYPEAIPLKNITARTIVTKLLHFFTLFGLPRQIQSDRGTNFTSHLFESVVKELNSHHVTSSAYRPQSQGCLERFHQTLKSMLKKFCMESTRDWDDQLDWLLFAVRESPQESTGLSPFQMLFGRSIRGPLKVLQESLLGPTPVPNITVAKYVEKLRNTLDSVRAIVAKNLKTAQEKMCRHQKSAKARSFSVGEKVLVFFPVPGTPLRHKFSGPYVVQKQVSPTNYIIQTPNRRKDTQLVHVNLMKEYVERASEGGPKQQTILCVNVRKESTAQETQDGTLTEIPSPRGNPPNSVVLKDLPRYLGLQPDAGVASLLRQFPSITSDVPGSCNILAHDIQLVNPDVKPIRQAPYRLNPHKAHIMEQEVKYLLENKLAEPSVSPWSSPCLLVPKSDGSYRFCTDYRKVNNVTVMDSFPLPLIEDILDRVGNSKLITTLDLNKGYWQIPLTENAKQISSFVTPQGLFSYTVLSFGLCNAAATFQRVVNHVIRGLPGTAAYIDDLVIMADNEEDHLSRLRNLFERLAEVGLTLNLAKSKFNRGTVTYLGHEVGGGQIRPKDANVVSILTFPVPQNRRQVMQFLGLAGYYRRFCPNFSTVAAPLTALTSTKRGFAWTPECQRAFQHLKAFLSSSPVLRAPDYTRPFHLYVDASGVGVGAVLLQEAQDTGILHPTSYYSARLKSHEASYSTIEKEALALVKALKKFECYLLHHPEAIVVHSDHNPLTFIKQSRLKNQRVMRWALMLQDYNFVLRHVKGVDNMIADCLSRYPGED